MIIFELLYFGFFYQSNFCVLVSKTSTECEHPFHNVARLPDVLASSLVNVLCLTFFYPSLYISLFFVFAISRGAYHRLAVVQWEKTGVPGVKPLLGAKGWVPQGQNGAPLLGSHSDTFYNCVNFVNKVFFHFYNGRIFSG